MIKVLSVLVVMFALVGCRVAFVPVPIPDKLPDVTVLEPTVVTVDAPVIESEFLQEFGDGTWIVGVDIEPGMYFTDGNPNEYYCSWERISGFGGTGKETLGSGFTSQNDIVKILPDDLGFISDGCGNWYKKTESQGAPLHEFGNGTWRVGIDIEPGTYVSTSDEECSWYRLSAFTGVGRDRIAAGSTKGRVIITIEETDAGLVTSSCGTWVKLN